jgi:hypothetical protein
LAAGSEARQVGSKDSPYDRYSPKFLKQITVFSLRRVGSRGIFAGAAFDLLRAFRLSLRAFAVVRSAGRRREKPPSIGDEIAGVMCLMRRTAPS